MNESRAEVVPVAAFDSVIAEFVTAVTNVSSAMPSPCTRRPAVRPRAVPLASKVVSAFGVMVEVLAKPVVVPARDTYSAFP